MRIKAVLRDSNILEMDPGSRKRVLAVIEKNLDRPVNWRSMLKVMGLEENNRTKMLDMLEESPFHIFLATHMQQDIVYLSRKEQPQDFDIPFFQWQ